MSIADVERARVFHDHTVVASSTRIAAVGAKVRIRTGARVIDARSKMLILGLRYMHSHSANRWK